MNELTTILSEWNQWWSAGVVSSELSGKIRGYTKELIDLTPVREIKILTGVRRSGKSTLFYQIIDWLIKSKKISPKQILLINFEDEALANFTIEDIFNAYRTDVFPADKIIYLFLDEIQQNRGWEKWIRKKYDLKKKINFFVTGSSANLLKPEYATLLTGRNITRVIYPLSFKEILLFNEITIENINLLTQDTKNLINNLLSEYMKSGGFPEIVFYKPDIKRKLLNQFFSDIIYKDIVNRYGCQPARIKDLAGYLLTNISSPASHRALRNALGFGLNTIGEYLSYLEDAFLVFQLFSFDYSYKKQLVNPRKIYAIDIGLRNAVAFKFSRDTGRILENIVFLELKRRNLEMYYWKDKRGKEIDFLIRQDTTIKNAIQVCADPSDKKTLKRELSALEAAMNEFKLDKGLVITMSETGKIKIGGKIIKFVPVYEWLII